MTELENRHATALVLADKGVLLEGESGSGKSALALSLLRQTAAAGHFARLVADDQVYLSTSGGRLLATAPQPIAGLVEVWGLGPAGIAFEAEAVLDLAVTLVGPEEAPRYSEEMLDRIGGASIRRLLLPARNEPVAGHAILAALDLDPFTRQSAAK